MSGIAVVAAGLAVAFVVTAIASLSYRPGGHGGSPADWLRIAGYLVAMAVGAPLHLSKGVDHGQLRLVPMTITAVLVSVAWWRGRRAALPEAAVCAVTAAGIAALLGLCVSSRLPSYGNGVVVHFSVGWLPAGLGMAVVAGGAYALAGHRPGHGWDRAMAATMRATAVIAVVGVVTAIGAAIWWGRFPAKALGAVPALLGDGTVWFGGFSLGGRLTANLSSPIPFLSGTLGNGLVSGGVRAQAYLLLLVPLAAAAVAGHRLRRATPAGVHPWAEFGRAVACNAVLWLVLAQATRLRFSGSLGADRLSGSAGLDLASTVFCAALWGAVAAVVALSARPPD